VYEFSQECGGDIPDITEIKYDWPVNNVRHRVQFAPKFLNFLLIDNRVSALAVKPDDYRDLVPFNFQIARLFLGCIHDFNPSNAL
jgi:hypothetical protein